jgi:type I restriction enzyme, S subunit
MMMTTVKLNDHSAFELIGGLWKGERAPLMQGRVLRSTNFNGDGILDFGDVVELEVEARHAATKQLKDGDIVVERSGGGPKQPVGRVALFNAPDQQAYFSSNFTTTLRIRNHKILDPKYASLYLHALYLNGDTETLQRATTGIRNLDWSEYLNFEIPLLPIYKQKALGQLIGQVRTAYHNERKLLQALTELKQATMQQLFTRGLRGESQKETEIGLMPESWSVDSIGSHFNVVSGGTPSRGTTAYWMGGTIPWVKTTEVNYCVIKKTEEHITQAGLSDSAAKILPEGTLLLAMYGQGVTRGRVAMLGIEATCNQACAAITKKDDEVIPKYLYHFLTWRYSAIRELAHGGQQQNLNLDIVREMPIAYPNEPNVQQSVVEILDATDQKIALHKEKQAVLEELFRALLHKLMTGELSVNDLDLTALQDFARSNAAPATTEGSTP